ncbi:MAG: hypothetical protein WCE62_15225 [Polyangiales bacterium]
MAWSILLLGLLPSSGLAQATEPSKTESASIEYVPAVEVPAQPESRKAEKPSFTRPWRSNSKRGRWRAIGIGTAGVAAGFVAHELGHVFMNLAYGNVPTFEGLRYAGFIPFFRISPGIYCNQSGCFHADGSPFKGGRSGVYLITSAGFNVQHLVSELILSLDPELRYHRSPFQKGMLFFNLSLSGGYVLSTWFQVKPPVGDIQGMAAASQLNPNWVALMVLIPAGLDLYRFFVPNSKWAPWVSRAAKVTFLGVSFAF